MNQKINTIFNDYELGLSDEDKKSIMTSLEVKNLRKNPTPEVEAQLHQLCKLIQDNKTIPQALAEMGIQTAVSEDNPDAIDFDEIIIEQANKAADAALFSLPNLAQAETEQLRQKFIQQFRSRIQEQLQSPEFQQSFITQIECLGELPPSNSSTMNIALPSSSSSNS